MKKVICTILLMMLLTACSAPAAPTEPKETTLQPQPTQFSTTQALPTEEYAEPTKEGEFSENWEESNPPEAQWDENGNPVAQTSGYLAPWKTNVVTLAKQDGKLHYYFMSSEGKPMISTGINADKWGDCCLMVLPDGTTVMIDTGHRPYAQVLVQNLKQMGIQRIDYLVISHYHGDHVGGAVEQGGLLDNFSVGQVYITIAKDNITSGLAKKCKDLKIPLTALMQDDEKQLGQLRMRVLWPTDAEAGITTTDSAQINDTSLVVRFDYKGHSSLFTGDIYSGVEQTLVSKYPTLLDVDLLKAPHHGDNTSSSPSFAAAVSPKLVVATGYEKVGQAVHMAYAMTGAQVLDDISYGYVHITVDGTKMIWESSR